MNNLYLKYHGLPGIGVTGQTGATGESGNGIYFGYVTDFFDGDTKDVDEFVKVVAIKNSSDNQFVLNQRLLAVEDAYKYAEGLYGDVSLAKEYLINLITNASSYYSGIQYSGKQLTDLLNIADASLNSSVLFDIDNNIISMMSALSSNDKNSFTLSGGYENDVEDITYYNASSYQLHYYDIYDYNELNNEYINVNNITYNTAMITYEPEDAAGLIEKFNEYYPYTQSIIPDDSIFTLINDNARPVSTGIDEGLVAYVKDRFTELNGVTSYLLGPDALFANIHKDFIDGSLHNYEDADYISTGKLSKLEDMQYFAKNAVELNVANSSLKDYDEEFYISEDGKKLKYYGFALNDDGTSYTVDNADSSTILGKLSSVLGTDIYKPKNKKAITKYITRVTLTLNSLITKGSSVDHTNDIVNNITWIDDENNTIKIPTTLSSKYKKGDILYFYTDELDFMKTYNVPYMVTITDELVGCTVKTLIENATMTNPLTSSILRNINGRVTATDPIIVTLSSNGNSSLVTVTDKLKFTSNSLDNIISAQHTTDTVILVDNLYPMESVKNQYLSCEAIDTVNNVSTSMLFTANNTTNSDALSTILADAIRFDNMIIKNDSVITNVEAHDAVYNDNIILNTEKFVTPLTELDEYLIDNNVYIGHVLNASSYFKDTSAMDKYVYGYELYSYDGLLIETHLSHDPSTLFLMKMSGYDKSILDTYVKKYNIAGSITITCPTNSSLDWSGLTYTYQKIVVSLGRLYFMYDSDVYGASKRDTENTVKLLVALENNNIYTYASETENAVYQYDEIGALDSSSVNPVIKSIKEIYNNQDNIVYSDDIVVESDDNVQFEYYLAIFAGDEYGIKHYSKMSYISVLMKDNYIVSFGISLIDDDVHVITTTDNSYIKFITSSITSDEVKNGSLYIEYDAENLVLKLILFNSSLDDNYANSWFSIVDNDAPETYVFDMTSNVPELNGGAEYNGSTINEFMCNCADSSNELECSLFYRLNNNLHFPSSLARYVTVTAGYTLDDNSTLQYESYNITQPGFVDYRDVPDISLDLHSDFARLEQYNTIENGVLCNQFVTYMDIKVSNFLSTWGKYLDNSTNVKMDIEIKNIESDPIWARKYNVTHAITRRNTIKFIPTETVNNTSILNNYISMGMEFVENSSITDASLALSIDQEVSIQNSSSGEAVAYDPIHIEDGSLNGDYIFFDDAIMKASKSPNVIYNGINDDFTINITNLNVNTAQDDITFRTKFNFEIGNPVLTNIYLRFAVTKITITYDTYINGKLVTKTFSTLVPELKISGLTSTYLYNYSSNYIETYKFISNPLDIMINPISYTVCDETTETNMSNILAAVMKTGPSNIITTNMKFYNSSLYTNSAIMDLGMSDCKNYLYKDWNSARMMAKYLQDNVKSIDVNYLAISDYADKYDDNTKGLLATLSNEAYNYTNTFDMLNGDRYLSIVYNSAIMNPKYREDNYTWYYNNKEYEKDRYDQLTNNYPVFVNNSQGITVRTDTLLNSMDTWNFEYLKNTKSEYDYTFPGQNEQYANGYMYLNKSLDINQYATVDDDIYSLETTCELNNIYIYDYSESYAVSNEPLNKFEPKNKDYFRAMLYNINWEYPMYIDDNKVLPYLIVSGFDYLVNYINNNCYDIELDNQYVLKLQLLIIKNENMLPYNVLFDIQPRVACNTDNETINMLMLRRPSIGTDNDGENDFNTCYNLTERYFELTSGQSIKQLPIPYNVKE